MSRRLLLVATATVLGIAVVAPVTASADPTTPPAAPPASDTATVCRNVATTLKGGWPAFQTTLQQAKDKLRQRDLGGTQASLKQAGLQLQALGGQVKQDGSQATDATLQSTTTQLGDQLTSLGGSLTSLTGLKSFNPGKLAPLSRQLATTCKGDLVGVPLPG